MMRTTAAPRPPRGRRGSAARSGPPPAARAAAPPGLVALFAAALACGPVAAQEAADPDLSTEGMRRAGPFYLRPFVLLKDVGYDDNIRLDAQHPEGDLTATAGSGLAAVVLAGDRGGLNLFQQFDYVSFRDNSDLNHWNSSSRARGVLLLKRAALSVEERYTSQRERPNTEVDRRLRRDENALSLGARSRGRGRLGWGARAGHERVGYTSEDAESEIAARRLDRDERSLSLSGELRILPKTTFLLEGVVESIEFNSAAEARDGRAVSVLPGLRFDPSASVQGEIRFGVTEFEALDRDGADYRGPVGEGRLSARLGSRGRLKGTFVRELVFSTLAENLYFIGTQWSGAYEQFFSRRLSAEISYGRGLNHYPEPVAGAGSATFERDDRLRTYQAAVRYRLDRRLLFTLMAQRLERDSSDDRFDRERNLYVMGTQYDF